jgi:hypothetical protein
MQNRKWSRRDVLKTSTALAAAALFAEPVKAAAPPPTSVTPALIESARKEGNISYYSAFELNVAERLAKNCLTPILCGTRAERRDKGALHKAFQGVIDCGRSAAMPKRELASPGRNLEVAGAEHALA